MTKPKLVWTAYEIFDAQFKGDLILLKDGYKKFLDADEVKIILTSPLATDNSQESLKRCEIILGYRKRLLEKLSLK